MSCGQVIGHVTASHSQRLRLNIEMFICRPWSLLTKVMRMFCHRPPCMHISKPHMPPLHLQPTCGRQGMRPFPCVSPSMASVFISWSEDPSCLSWAQAGHEFCHPQPRNSSRQKHCFRCSHLRAGFDANFVREIRQQFPGSESCSTAPTVFH